MGINSEDNRSEDNAYNAMYEKIILEQKFEKLEVIGWWIIYCIDVSSDFRFPRFFNKFHYWLKIKINFSLAPRVYLISNFIISDFARIYLFQEIICFISYFENYCSIAVQLFTHRFEFFDYWHNYHFVKNYCFAMWLIQVSTFNCMTHFFICFK